MFNRRLAILCITLLVSVGSWQTAQAKGGISNKITRYAVTTAMSLGLVFGGVATQDVDAHGVKNGERHERIQQLHAQEAQQESLNIQYSSSGSPDRVWNERLGAQDGEELDIAWGDEVTQGNGVFYLALRNPDYEHIHHVVYVGDTATGEPMFAGIYLVGHENDYIQLYAHDGLVAQGFMQRDIVTYPDPLGLYSEVTVFTIKDLSIAGRYAPVSLSLDLPVHEEGKALQMVQFGKNPDNPETLADLPQRQRSCEVLAPNVWAEIPGIIRSSCTPLAESHGAFGAPIFSDGIFVGFFTETAPSGANLSEGMTPEFVQFLLDQRANPTAVDPNGKAATMLGRIKMLGL